MCSSCGEIFDELREVWHHKWDAHPRCLVMHVTLPRIKKPYLPPHSLIHPQLGRQLAVEYGAVTQKYIKMNNTKKRKGRRTNVDKRDSVIRTPQISEVNESYQCKKCNNKNLTLDSDGDELLKFDTKEKFYVHLLECGGDVDWEGKRDKKKKGSKKNSNQSTQPKGNYINTFNFQELEIEIKIKNSNN